MKENQIHKIEELLEANENLKKENALLKLQNKSYKQFSYLASHDLQQPVNNIISYLSILEDSRKNLDNMGNLCLDVIKKSSFKMKKFITSLLDYNLIGSQEKNEIIDVDHILQLVKEELSETIDKTNTKIEIKTVSHQFKAHSNDIFLLFLNLIENAIKFSNPKKNTTLKITSEIKNNAVMYSIKDNGIGIEQDYHKKIFDIFFIINRNEDDENVGIGLPICKKIVDIYEGKIWLESELNVGSTFYFTLPLK